MVHPSVRARGAGNRERWPPSHRGAQPLAWLGPRLGGWLFSSSLCMTSVRRDKYRYFACLLRDRFDKNKDIKDMVKATELLKAGEAEFWANQHPQPYIFPDSPGGTSYERYELYKVRCR